MNPVALILMLAVQIPVVILTVYFVVCIMKSEG